MSTNPTLPPENDLRTVADLLSNISDVSRENLKTVTDTNEQHRKLAKNVKTVSDVETDRLKVIRGTEREFSSFASSYKKLSKSIRAQLGDTKLQLTAYGEISKMIARQNSIAKTYNGIIKDNAEYRADILTTAQREYLDQARANARQEDSLKGITDFQRNIMDIESQRSVLGNAITDATIKSIQATELLYNKEQRIAAIREQQQGLLEAAPPIIGQSIGFAEKLGEAMKTGLGPMMLIGVVLATALSYFSDISKAGEEFRKETGMLNSQLKAADSNVNSIVGSYAKLGIEASDVYETIGAVKKEFSDVVNISEEATAALTVLGKNFGVSAENAAKVQNVLENIGGLSSDTAANVQLQIAGMSKLAGVAPSKVFQDIAESAALASTLFHGDIIALAKQAVEARRLGTSIKEIADTNRDLLDFESSITNEMEAAAMAGGRFNLTKARSLAYNKQEVAARNEVLHQLEDEAGFSQQNLFAQESLAKAAGMSVEDITKQLHMREKLASLSTEEKKAAEDAISKGMDISNISKDQLRTEVDKFAMQQEQQSQLSSIENSVKSIAASVGSILLPILNAVATVFTFIADTSAGIVGFLGTMAALTAVIYANKIKTLIVSKQEAMIAAWNTRKSIVGAIASIFQGQGKLPIVGAILAATMVGGMFAAISKASKIGDMSSPASGKTTVSTKEGGIFELSPHDDLVAAPGLLSSTSTNGNTSVDLEVLLNPLNQLLSSIQGLRADLNAGKIAVYMDGKKLTAAVAAQAGRVTSNSYSR